MNNETITNNEDFNEFVKYVGGNQNLIDSIHDIERDPKAFSHRMMNEIEKFGLSYDTAASELRCELIGYLLLHKEDAVGFELGKLMFKHMKKSSTHHDEVWCFLIGKGLQRILESSQSSKETEIWYPLEVRGVFVPFQYASTDYLEKEKICSTRDDCQKLCDDLNVAKGGDDWCFKHIDMLVSEYGSAKNSDLTDTAKELKNRVISKVNEWKEKLDARKTNSECTPKVPETECKHKWSYIDVESGSCPPIHTRRCLKCGRNEHIPQYAATGTWTDTVSDSPAWTEGKGY